jgi:hypothetical protein
MESNRREFLENLGKGGVAVAFSLLNGGSAKAEKGPKTEIQSPKFIGDIIRLHEMVSHRKLDLEKKENISQEIDNLLHEIFNYNLSLGSIRNPEEMNPVKETLWQALKTYNSELPDHYSDQSYYKYVLDDLPKILAKYGILFCPEPIFIKSQTDNSSIQSVEIRMKVYSVEEVNNESRILDGEAVSAPVAQVKDYKIDNRVINSSKPSSIAEAYAQNIIFYENGPIDMSRITPESLQIIKKMLSKISTSKEQKWQNISSANSSDEQYQKSILVAYIDAFSSVLNSMGDINDPKIFRDLIIDHELGHLVTCALPDWEEKNSSPKEISKLDKYYSWLTENHIRNETGAYLYALSVSDNPLLNIAQLLSGLNSQHLKKLDGNTSLNSYQEATSRILNAIVEEISKNINSYGLILKKESNVDVRSQIIFNLVDVVKEEGKRKMLFKALIDKFKNDFSLKTDTDNVYDTPSKDTTSDDSCNFGVGASIAALALMAARALRGFLKKEDDRKHGKHGHAHNKSREKKKKK